MIELLVVVLTPHYAPFSRSYTTKTEHLSTDKCSVFAYPSRRLGISSPREVRCISSAPLGLYIITHQRVSSLRLDDIQQQVADDIHAFGVIETRGCEKLLNYLTKHDIIPLKGVMLWLKTTY